MSSLNSSKRIRSNCISSSSSNSSGGAQQAQQQQTQMFLWQIQLDMSASGAAHDKQAQAQGLLL